MAGIYRLEKINSLVQQILAGLIAKEFCFSHEIIISLTHVETTGNLFEAKVFISVFPNEERKRIVAALNKDVVMFQHALNKKLRMRPVPRIIFKEDPKPEQAQAVEEMLAKIEKNKKI